MLTFRIRNTRLHLSIWFFAILYLFLIMDRQQFYPLFFGSIFLHEAAHLIIMIWWKKKILSISLLPFGIRVSTEETVIQSYGQEISITLAGPLANFICAAGCLWCLSFHQSLPLAVSAAVNLVLGAFNLLPIGVLDGGRLLTQFLQMRGCQKTEKITSTVSLLFLLPLLSFSIWLFLFHGHNPSLLITGIYLTSTAIFKAFKN